MSQDQTDQTQHHLARTLANPEKMELAKAVMRSENPSPGRYGKKIPGVERNNSGVSLEYSIDSTVVGQQHATDASPARVSRQYQKAFVEEESSVFSIQESTSSMDFVPTDEELFAEGWAKALDPRSGSYYYFTLDRKKTVWDNPIGIIQGSTDTGDSSTLAEGRAAI
jgi:hypothetical protein